MRKGQKYTMSEAHKKKISQSLKGKMPKFIPSTKGLIKTPEHREKLRQATLKNPIRYWKGKKLYPHVVKQMSESRKGIKTRPCSEETKRKIGDSHRGDKNWNWKGGKENTKMLDKLKRARKRNAEGSHSWQDWDTLKAQYNWTCPSCKRKEPEIKLTEDHIIPLIKGGSNNIENIQPLCLSCNSRKHTQIIKYDI